MEILSLDKINAIINHTINHWTNTFGIQNHNTSEARSGLLNYINMINNFYKIGNYGDGYIDNIRNQAFSQVQTILTNAYNKGIHYWAEGMLHQVSHRITWINNNDTFLGFDNKIFNDFKHNINIEVIASTLNVSSLNIYHYSERTLHEISYYVYQKIIEINMYNHQYKKSQMDEYNQLKLQMEKNILIINQILNNLHIKYSFNETLETKLKKLLKCSN
ncbi:1066_t:CDS:2 [Cetraspora pellucida]|uniref:1066_t:CDS:1 n=1 Tax=Cetraspora pellucida TaxID=1433469 RepID=A0A9N9HUI2_9GLOM|nr:1066_t:CDS:2 [Cetraspora pellucida]